MTRSRIWLYRFKLTTIFTVCVSQLMNFPNLGENNERRWFKFGIKGDTFTHTVPNTSNATCAPNQNLIILL